MSELCARAIVMSGQTGKTEQAWIDLEAAYLSALFSYTATLPEPTLLTAYRLFTRRPQEELLRDFLASASSAAVEQANIFKQTQERMRGSIVPVVASKLMFMRDEAIARFTSASLYAPDFGKLRRTPCAIYWSMREHDIERLRPLSAVFFTLMLEQLAAEEIREGEASIPTLCLLDEFAHLGVIPSFPTALALSRARQIGISIGIQSVGQLAANYGDDQARVILDNCTTKIALSSLDLHSATYFSESLGEATIVTKRKARQRRWFLWQPTSTTITIQEHARALLTPDEVRRTSEDKAIVISANLRPMLLKKYFYNAPAKEALTSRLGEALAMEVPFVPEPPRRRELPPIPEDLPRRLQLVG